MFLYKKQCYLQFGTSGEGVPESGRKRKTNGVQSECAMGSERGKGRRVPLPHHYRRVSLVQISTKTSTNHNDITIRILKGKLGHI